MCGEVVDAEVDQVGQRLLLVQVGWLREVTSMGRFRGRVVRWAHDGNGGCGRRCGC